MPSPNKTNSIPPLPKGILRQLQASESPFVAGANDMIGQLNTLSKKLPHRYGWRYRTVEAMNSEMATIESTAVDALPLNTLYWRDQLSNWEAYSLMNTFRIIDLARSCVWAVARKDAVCASLLARSTLETAAAFVDAARTVSATIIGPTAESKPSPIIDPDVDLRKVVITSEELERISLKTIFASRLPESDAIYSPTNIVTIITRVSKIQGKDFVLPTYHVLCETAHPNMLGRALYIHGAEPGPWKGNELRTLGPGNGPAWHFLLEPVVTALSWGCAAQVSAFNLMAEAIGTVIGRINAVGKAPR